MKVSWLSTISLAAICHARAVSLNPETQTESSASDTSLHARARQPDQDVWTYYKEKGEKLWSDFEDIKADDNYEDKATLENLHDTYTFRTDAIRKPRGAAKELYENLGISTGQGNRAVALTANEQNGNTLTNYDNGFNPTGGFLIANAIERGPDSNYWSDVAWALWKGTVESWTDGDVALSGLKYMFQKDIQNEDSSEIMSQITKSSGKTLDETPQCFQPCSDEFSALVATPNGSTMMRIVMDHYKAVGEKDIDEVCMVLMDDDSFIYIVLSD